MIKSEKIWNREDVPYISNLCNPAPDDDIHSVKPENFEWIVEATANMAIRRAQAHREGLDNLTRGEFVTAFVNNDDIIRYISYP